MANICCDDVIFYTEGKAGRTESVLPYGNVPKGAVERHNTKHG